MEKNLSYLNGKLLAVFGEIAIATDRPLNQIGVKDKDLSHLLVNVEVWDIQTGKKLATSQASLGQLRANVTNLRQQGNKLLALAFEDGFEPIE